MADWILTGLIETERHLLVGLPRGGIAALANLVERALKERLGAGHGGKMLGELIRGAREADVVDKDDLARLNVFNKLRIEAVHPVDDASLTLERAEDAVAAVAVLFERWGLADRAVFADARRQAGLAVRATSDAFHQLDRTAQKRCFSDALDGSPTLLAFLADGERGQGQEHFTNFARWKLKKELQGSWRELEVTWPARGLPPGSRFVELVQRLVIELAVASSGDGVSPLDLPLESDPLGAGASAWTAAIESLVPQLARSRRAVLVRHRIQWPDDADRSLLELYLARVWKPLAPHLVDPVVLGLEIVRTPRTGVPFIGRTWRAGARERSVALGVTRSLALVAGARTQAVMLPELTSVPVADIAAWLISHRDCNEATARSEAQRIVEISEGGRFSLVVDALSQVRGSQR
ncbi:MAG: hypothetical protein Q8O67_18625 [Deltaproteobacteria bacterium]|nr:hypothetical protein [Deltaproteobacteria bacterium]